MQSAEEAFSSAIPSFLCSFVPFGGNSWSRPSVSFGQPLELSTLLPKSSCAFRSEASSVMDLRWPRRTLLCLENSTAVVVQSTRTVLCTAPCAGGGGRNLSFRDRVEGTKVDGRVLFASRRRGDRQALATSLSLHAISPSPSGRRERDGQNDTQHSVQAELAGIMAERVLKHGRRAPRFSPRLPIRPAARRPF